MRVLMGLITALSIPFMILNMSGGVVSGIWLAILGEWSAGVESGLIRAYVQMAVGGDVVVS